MVGFVFVLVLVLVDEDLESDPDFILFDESFEVSSFFDQFRFADVSSVFPESAMFKPSLFDTILSRLKPVGVCCVLSPGFPCTLFVPELDLGFDLTDLVAVPLDGMFTSSAYLLLSLLSHSLATFSG